MWRGTGGLRSQPAVPRLRTARSKTRCNGGFTFAENPELEAPEARIIWHAALDPGTLAVRAAPVAPGNPDRIELDRLRPWLSVATDRDSREHAVLSDGLHHIRLDCDGGSLSGSRPIQLHYLIRGTVSAEPAVLPLRRFLHLHRHQRFSPKLFPDDPRVERWLTVLRVHDAARAGASHRDIAEIVFGQDRVPPGRAWKSEALNARVDRLAREARRMAAGAYRLLLARPAA